MSIEKLITQGENRRVEFKEQLPKNDSIVKTIISFSNTSGGKLIIGVDDNRKASFDNIIELERQRRNISFDEELNHEVELSSLDLSPLYDVFKKVNRPLDHQKLKNLKLIKEEHGKEYPSNALLILLGYYDHCMVKCAKFKGTTMELFLDKKEYSGSIFEILEKSLNFILNHINLRAEIKGLYRTDTYEIPLVALREALINALIHRDYIHKGRDIKVGIYDDIVNIISCGGYPNSISQSDIDNGRSDARNRVVANVFKELGLIEQWGSGIARIKSSCLEFGLKEPLIRELNDFVDVEFYRPVEVSEMTDYDRLVPNNAEKPSESIGKVSDNEQIILNYIQKQSQVTSKEVESLLALKEARARRILKEMVEKELVIRLGSGRSTYYVLKGK